MVNEVGSHIPVDPKAVLRTFWELKTRSITQFRNELQAGKPALKNLEADMDNKPDNYTPETLNEIMEPDTNIKLYIFSGTM